VREHRRPGPERSLGHPAVARDQVGGKDAVRDEPLAFAVEFRCDLAGAHTGPWRLAPQDLRSGDRRHGHRLDLDVGAPLISVDLQEHVADAQGRALVVGDDDLDLLHVGQYRGDDHRLSPGFIAWGYMARTAMPG